MENTLRAAMIRAFEMIRDQQAYLCEIDAETGDGDHGITMRKIADAICAELRKETGDETLSQGLFDASGAVMRINGGSAIPLWAMMLDGMGEATEKAGDVKGAALLAALLDGALAGFLEISTAQIGEKTMRDVLEPAADAARSCAGQDAAAACTEVAQAAEKAAEATKGMKAKYGRAKDMHEGSIGHYDPGARSMSMILQEICAALKEG